MFQNRRTIVVAAAGLFGIAVAAGSVWADDLTQFRPDWRGQPGTTYQQWAFLDDENPAAPEVIDNEYGAATASLTVKQYGAGWQPYLITAPDRLGVWADLDSVVLEIDNRPDPLEFKEIWLQITYYEGSANPPAVAIFPDATLLDFATVDVGPVDPFGKSWIVQYSRWRIEPNPAHETITITPDGPLFGITIDQIVVDTICIPEPATVTLLLGGLLGTVSFRRRRRA